jgi:hypothetical protein
LISSANLTTKRSFLPSDRDGDIFGRALNYFISHSSFFSEICSPKFPKLFGEVAGDDDGTIGGVQPASAAPSPIAVN